MERLPRRIGQENADVIIIIYFIFLAFSNQTLARPAIGVASMPHASMPRSIWK